MAEKKLNVNQTGSSLSKSLGMNLGIGLNLNLITQSSLNSSSPQINPTSTGSQ